MRHLGVFSVLAIVLLTAGAGAEEVVVDSKPFLIDRALPHMHGESFEKAVQLESKIARPKLFWLTGASVTRSEKEGPKLDEYMCHAWVLSKNDSKLPQKELSFKTFSGTSHSLGRLFTLSVNQPEVRFPSGFGIPYDGSEKLSFYFMVASAHSPPKPYQRVLRGRLEYQPDDAQTKEFQALFRRSLASVVGVQKDACHFGKPPEFKNSSNWKCSVGKSLPFMHFKDQFGKKFSAHWWAPPGKSENFTLITSMLNLPFDSTIHSISVHIHPGVIKVSLKDLTDGKEIFVGEPDSTSNSDDKAIAKNHLHVSPTTNSYSSQQGIPVFRDHEYALITVVDNKTQKDIDIMSTLHIYIRDKKFSRTN